MLRCLCVCCHYCILRLCLGRALLKCCDSLTASLPTLCFVFDRERISTTGGSRSVPTSSICPQIVSVCIRILAPLFSFLCARECDPWRVVRQAFVTSSLVPLCPQLLILLSWRPLLRFQPPSSRCVSRKNVCFGDCRVATLCIVYAYSNTQILLSN